MRMLGRPNYRRLDLSMFLLSDDQVLRQMSQRRLRITPFREDRLYSTCYYFGLARTVKIRDAKRPITRDLTEGPVVLDPGDLVIVQSEEYFSLPSDVLMLWDSRPACRWNGGCSCYTGQRLTRAMKVTWIWQSSTSVPCPHLSKSAWG